jgi:transposase InsO family protein
MSHPNARLTIHGRLIIAKRIEAGWTVSAAARAAGVSRQTATKWVRRYREHGEPGLCDLSSRPHRLRPGLPKRRVRRIIKARLTHRRGPRWLSWRLGIAASTIYAVLRRFGLNRLKTREREPSVRYEWPEPGDLLHLDVKKLGRVPAGGGKRAHGPSAESRRRGRGIGWDFVHVAVDDHSRLAYAEILPDERAEGTVDFLDRALDFFECAGITVKRVLTDNGSNYRSRLFCDRLAVQGIAGLKTRPYRPQTNGKAEAFIKILINEWAYEEAYASNEKRSEMFEAFIHDYNLKRPHGGIGYQPPISRVR